MPRLTLRRCCWLWMIVGAALALHVGMAVSVSPRMGVTADEVVHLTGGYSYWKFNDYRLHPENGTLPMRLATLPWLAMDLKFPALTSYDWLHSIVNGVGDEFLYKLGNPLDPMMDRARLMIALGGAFTVWLTWRWARGLFGPRAGWVALVLAVFCPALLAHSGLATSDMVMTACVLGALSLTWRVFHRATPGNVLGAAVACGLAFLSKMSGVLIVPLIGLMLVVRWLRPAPFVWAIGRTRWLRHRGSVAGATTALTVAIAAGSLAVLWAGYDFRFSGFNREVSETRGYYVSWDLILDKAPMVQPQNTSLDDLNEGRHPVAESTMSHLIAWLRDHRVLPEAYLWGFAHTYKFSRYRSAFFLGEYRGTGWRTFFPVAFVLKTPLPALLLIATGVGTLLVARRRGRARLSVKPWVYRAAPLLLFFGVYWAMAISMKLNIGHRHILPTYPVFYVLASAVALWLGTGWGRRALIAISAALALVIVDSWASRPFYLSYFQPLFGGAERGYRYLVDSSYDWGQGLPDLARWLAAKRAGGDNEPVFLSYFGADSPTYRGIKATRFGDDVTDSGERIYPAAVRGGWFVISATHFRRVYLPVRGPWSERHEQRYAEIRARLIAAQSRMSTLTPAEQTAVLQDARDYEILSFGRLVAFLANRTPREVVGGSLLVFKLTDAEIGLALNSSLAELRRAAAAVAPANP